MKTDLNMELMKNIADLYYNSNLTQSEIAHRYNISRPKVSRLLADARENGIVKIFIDGRNEISRFQEEQLLKRFPLKAVKVISVPHDDDQLVALEHGFIQLLYFGIMEQHFQDQG